jgi:hypothetical protein
MVRRGGKSGGLSIIGKDFPSVTLARSRWGRL